MSRDPSPPPAAKKRRFPASLEGLSATMDKRVDDPKQALLRPQKPVQQAAADRQRRTVPAGVGFDSDAIRRRMVERLVKEGVQHPVVLRAFELVPRHMFIDSALVTQAYEDTSLPIGHGQTISKPSVVGRMLALLLARSPAAAPPSDHQAPLGRVLEIGTGCGYQAALLSLLSRSVISVERIKPLHDKARQHLDSLQIANVRLVWGDGRLGHAPNAPYDVIIAAAGGDDIPSHWLDQLAVGGCLIAPMHSPRDGGQVLVRVDRSETGFHRTIHDAVHFVPLKSGLE